MDDIRILSREDALSAQDRDGEWVEVPKWGGRFWVAEFGGRERDMWDRHIASIAQGQLAIDLDNIRARVVALSVVDPETLRPVFSYDDVEQLGRKSAASLDVIFQVATRLSGLDKGAIERLVDALKNALSSVSGVG